MHRALPKLQPDSFIKHPVQREVIITVSVHTEHRYKSSSSHGTECGLKCIDRTFFKINSRFQLFPHRTICFHTDRIDHHISTASSCHLSDLFNRIFLFSVDDFCFCSLCSDFQTIVEDINSDHSAGSFDPSRFHCHDSYRSGTYHCHGLSSFQL